MARLLPFLLVASLVVIAASGSHRYVGQVFNTKYYSLTAFDDEQEDSLDEIMVNEALADPVAYPEAKKGKGRKRKNKKGNKGKKQRKNKGNKKRKNSRCSTGRAAAQCGVDVVEALKFEGSVVDNFITQKKRALNFKGLVDKKKEKKAKKKQSNIVETKLPEQKIVPNSLCDNKSSSSIKSYSSNPNPTLNIDSSSISTKSLDSFCEHF